MTTNPPLLITNGEQEEDLLNKEKVMDIKDLGKIGLLSPSAPIVGFCPNRYVRAKQELERLGFDVVDTPQVHSISGCTAGTGKERAEALHALIELHHAKMIIATIGGYNSNDMLPHINFERIPEDLIVMGYSDATVLLHALHAQSRARCLQGPMVLPQFGECGGVDTFTLASLTEVLSKLGTGQVYALPKSNAWTSEYLEWDRDDSRRRHYQVNDGWWSIQPGKATGMLLPSNLNTFPTLTGTPYLATFTDPILFLEDVESETPPMIKRNLQHIAAVYGGDVQGIVFGRFAAQSTVTKEVLRELAQEVFPDTPTIANVDFGHTDPVLTLPVGAKVVIDSEGMEIRVEL